MIRQPVSVGGPGGGGDYESFIVGGNSTDSVTLAYYDPDGKFHYFSTYNGGYGAPCQKNSVYIHSASTSEPSLGRTCVNAYVKDGTLIMSVVTDM